MVLYTVAINAGRCAVQRAVKYKRKAEVAKRDCVACGCCTKVCPMRAIQIVKGVYAEVDRDKCVGCGKCAKECPATVITITEVPA